uniref:Uncharacterized protein n=1 Tax=Timema poppense TaxID=170557 RepID=A0A7R9DTT6_TIMPO|nr:unnamed protein product [Timema poppensis]
MSVELSIVKEKKGDYSARLNDHLLVVAIPGEMFRAVFASLADCQEEDAILTPSAPDNYLDPYDMENSLRVDPEA